MSKRCYPAVRARFYDAGTRYSQRFDGFGHYGVVADLWKRGQLTNDTVRPSDLGVGAGVGTRSETPTAMVLDDPRLNTVVCRPFLDTTQSIGADHFDLQGGSWLPLEGLGIGNEVRLYQYDGKLASPTGAVSRFSLPRSPVFCISLHRCDPAPGHDWPGNPPCTEIQLGAGSVSEWSLVIPYGGPAFLARRRSGIWETVPNGARSSALRGLEGYGPDGRMLIWIANWGGKLVVSTDGFADDLWVCPSGPERVEIPQGKLAVWHNAGQWAFSVIPVKMTAAQIDSLPLEAGYDVEACAGEVFVQPTSTAVRDDDGNVLAEAQVVDATGLRTDLSATQVAWRATLTPHVHTETSPAFETATSPELAAVQIGQYPEVVDTGAAVWHEVSEQVEAVVGHAADDGRASTYELSVDNALGQFAALGEYRRCDLDLGWVHDGGSTSYARVVSGYLVEPTPAVEAGPRDCMSVGVTDPLLRLRDEKCDGRAPVFDGWLVKSVMEWVLDRCSVPADLRDLEDTGACLSSGAFDRPLWLVEPGRPWGEFLREVAEFDYAAALFFTPEGVMRKACRHCRQKRTAEDVLRHDGSATGACVSEVRWELYTRVGLAASEDQSGAVLAIERPRRTLHESEFANYVAVCGLSGTGELVRSTICDADSLYDPSSASFVGWRKMEVAALETYTTQAETNRLAAELFRDLARQPEHVSVVIPLEPAMQVGDVVRINGAEQVGASGEKYRVRSVRHTVTRDHDKPATTHLVARRLTEEG